MTEFLHGGDGKRDQNRRLFNAIAHRYDFLNHFLSLGLDLYWRRRLVSKLPRNSTARLLDVATGTGDLAFTILKHRPLIEVTGLDNTEAMLARAQVKMARRGFEYPLVTGVAENLPFANGDFDFLTIAFGLRNIGFYGAALSEFYRTLKPGGQLLILEFGEPTLPVFRNLFRWYFHRILPVIGGWISGTKAYRYLPESVERFPPREELRRLITAAGFAEPEITRLSGGVVSLVTAYKATR